MDAIDAAIQDRAIATLNLVRQLRAEVGQYGRVTSPWLMRQLDAITAYAETGEPPVELKAKRALSLVAFLAKSGGLCPDDRMAGDLRAMGAFEHKAGKFGRLVRKGGRKLDYAREIAVEAGYLRDDAGINELLVAIDDEINVEVATVVVGDDCPF